MSFDKERTLDEPLLSTDEQDGTETEIETPAEWRYSEEFNRDLFRKQLSRRNLCFSLLIVVPWLLLVLLGVWNLIAFKGKRPYYEAPNLVYSPVQHLVEYETKIFTTGFPEDPSPYSGEPSPELDKIWQGLYPSVYQLIPKEEAAKLANKTVIFPHDPERRYIIELEVFHQLHCLNMIRQATRPDYYKPMGDDELGDDPIGHRHIAHCIDTIRQGLMCASDISVYTWEWNEAKGRLENQVKNPHVCRNWDKIAEWSTINTVRKYIDPHGRELNDPLDPSTWQEGYHGE